MQYSFLIIYSSFLIGSLVLALFMNNLFLKFVKNLGINKKNETAIRWSSESKPALGGITFYIVFLLSGVVYALFLGDVSEWLNVKSIGLFTATSLGFIIGLMDDVYTTRPIVKSLTQLTCALVLILTGTQIEIFEIDLMNKLLTVIWVVGIMNSLNMLDNMDGITGIVSFFVCLAITGLSISKGLVNDFNFIIVSGVLTSLVAFLYFNWHPAKMYMGDSGSQFLGITLSAMGIIYLWNPVKEINESISLSKQFILPLLAFLVPIVDTTTVTINRIREGKSPFIGGRDHTTHYLSRKGLGDKKVAYVMALISLISSLFVYLICTLSIRWNSTYSLIFLAYALLIFSMLFYFTRQKSN